MTIEVIRRERQTGRTTEALAWLGEVPNAALYVTDKERSRAWASQKAPRGVVCMALYTIANNSDRLRGYHFKRIVFDNRDFYQTKQWDEAIKNLQSMFIVEPDVEIREIREAGEVAIR